MNFFLLLPAFVSTALKKVDNEEMGTVMESWNENGSTILHIQ